MTFTHKVFLSYFHDEDADYRYLFERLFSNVVVSKSVEIGDIEPNRNADYVYQKLRDEYLRDSTVTVVLIGQHTWQRKFVDWEIYTTLRDTKNSPRSGLLGLILPTYKRPEPGKYNIYTTPPRLYDNVALRNDVQQPFAGIYEWSEDPKFIGDIIHEAFSRRDKIIPINSRPMFGKNHSGAQWTS